MYMIKDMSKSCSVYNRFNMESSWLDFSSVKASTYIGQKSDKKITLIHLL